VGGERPVATDEVLELLVVALGAERRIVVDRAADILVLLAPGSIGVLAAELHKGSNPAGAAHVLGRIGDPQTPALAKRWSMATGAFGPKAPPHWLGFKTPQR
jgi:hypothetical protein